MPNIHQRINAVQREVSYVQKDATVERYRAVSHDQVVSVARASMVKHGVLVIPDQREGGIAETFSTKSGGRMALYSGGYVIRFVNVDDPTDAIEVHINAHALDNGDKAPGKAVTYATKTALLKVLMLETGEQEESRAEIRESMKTITDEQAATIKALIEETQADVPRFLRACAGAAGIREPFASVDEMPLAVYEYALKGLEAKKAAMEKKAERTDEAA